MYDTPAFREAMADRTLRGSPWLVFLWCYEHLDTFEFRYVKQGALRTDLELKERVINRAFRLLVERRYLDVGPRSGRLCSFRLYHSRPAADGITAPLRPLRESIRPQTTELFTA